MPWYSSASLGELRLIRFDHRQQKNSLRNIVRNGDDHEISDISLINGSSNLTFVNRFDIIGAGSVPNFETHETAHVTVNAEWNYDRILR